MSSGLRTPENQQFTYNELKIITNDFEEEIGRGGFGSVYAGHLEDGTKVAVKKRSNSSSQGDTEFCNEANTLTKVHHKHLVSLMGYCKDGDCMALVYEYMPEGTLEDKLKDNERPFTWKQRLQIAHESAQGLEYLHKLCFIHRDVKTNNILLNSKLEAKIADFGLSREFDNGGASHVSTKVSGTPGYLDPSYYGSGQLTVRSDVYSFGVVMLEIVTGKPPLIRDQDGGFVCHVKDWVDERLSKGPKKKDQRLSREHIESVADPRMQNQYDINSIRKVIELAEKCIQQSPHNRPTMEGVTSELKASLQLETRTTSTTIHSHSTPVSFMPITTAIKKNLGFKNRGSKYSIHMPDAQFSFLNSSKGNYQNTFKYDDEFNILENRQFNYHELEMITNNFDIDNKIGAGDFGSVYVGRLENGTYVAVKVAHLPPSQAIKEFSSEVKYLSRVHHKSFVSLIGYCKDKNCLALVYDYVPEGSLWDKLRGHTLTWKQRLQIAYESAQGLDYLHTSCNPQLIHRNVKTRAILLNSNLEAKISGFVFAREFDKDDSICVTNTIIGSFGYVDPVYAMHGHLTKKSDVYSFGVVLLEIVTGRQPYSIVEGEDYFTIVQWVYQKKEHIENVIDPSMQGQYDINSIEKVIELALKCTEETPSTRPTTDEVVDELKACLKVEKSAEKARTTSATSTSQHTDHYNNSNDNIISDVS